MKITKGLQNDVKQTKISMMGGSRRRREKRPGKFYEEIMPENFPHLGKEIVTSPLELKIR